jgi:hypothetical protein
MDVFVGVLVVVILIVLVGYSGRKKSVEEGTWLGMSGAKASYLWNRASSEQRSLMLAAISILDEQYRDGLLSKNWTDLPSLVQTSLADTLEEIRRGVSDRPQVGLADAGKSHSVDKRSGGMTDDEKQQVLDTYKLAANPTDRMMQLAREMGQLYDSKFDAALNSGKLQQVAHAGATLSFEEMARLVASEIGEGFSSRFLTELFKDATLSEGWTLNDALPVWYSLGNLALLIAVWTTYNDAAKATPIISRCRSLLQKHWKMSEDVFEKLRAVIAETEASAFASFVRCKDGKDLMLFFHRYVSRICGAPVPFSERSMFEDHMMGIKYVENLFTEAAVCGFFVDTCGRTKGFLLRS